jgi:hypothetical protein
MGIYICERITLLLRLLFFDGGDELVDLVSAEEARGLFGDDRDLEVLLGVVDDFAERLGEQAGALDDAELLFVVLLEVVDDGFVVLAA